MPRQATGSIENYTWKDGRTVTWRLRVRANGKRHRIDLGTNHQGWNRARAQVELDHIREMVERGTWEPQRESPPAAIDASEVVSATADRWWARKETQLRPSTQADYRWRLKLIMAGLGHERAGDLTIQRIDEFRDRLARLKSDQTGKPLSPRSINMILDVLAQVLDDAVEYGLLEQNPARGKRRRMRVGKSPRSFLEPDMVVDLLDAAGEWEASLPEHQRYGRRAFLALLCLAGPRISEAVAADRGDFDLAVGRWRIPAAKTAAGERDIELPVALAEELRSHVASMQSLGRPTGARKPMWPTASGGRLNPSNVRTRLLAKTVEKANEGRGEREVMLLPTITPHGLRRTFASLCFFVGRDPRFVMAQLGHADPRMTLGVYAQTMQRQRVDRGLVWRLMRFGDEPEAAPTLDRNGTGNGTTTAERASDADAKIPPA